MQAVDSTRGSGQLVIITFLHILILGAARVGKTSLIRSLQNILWDGIVPVLSTTGIKMRTMAVTLDDNGKWVPIKTIKELTQNLTKLLCSTARKVIATPRRTAEPAKESPVDGTVQDDATHVVPAGAGAIDAVVEAGAGAIDAVIEEMSSKKMTEDIRAILQDPKFSLIRVSDMAGQKQYRCFQPLVMNPDNVTILTFDASRRLTELAKVEEFQTSSGTERLPTYNREETGIDQLLDWVDSMVLCTPTKVKADRSRVLFVGCKKDEAKKNKVDLKQHKHDLKKALSRKHGRSVEVSSDNLFFVDNTMSGSSKPDGDIDKLREQINELVSSQKEVPVKYMHFTLALSVFRDSDAAAKLPWIDKSQVQHLAESQQSISAGNEEELCALLDYQHSLGMLAYFNTPKLKNKVIIDVQFVLDAIAALLCLDIDKETRKWKLKYKRGRLPWDVIVTLLKENKDLERHKAFLEDPNNVNFLLLLMEELSLICEVPEDGEPSNTLSTADNSPRLFLFPAAATTDADDIFSNVPQDGDPEESEPILLVLKQLCYFPLYLYWQLSVGCLMFVREKWGREVDSSVITRTRILIPWEKQDESCGRFISLTRCKQGICVQVVRTPAHRSAPTDQINESMEGVDVCDALEVVLGKIQTMRSLPLDPSWKAICRCGAQTSATCFVHGKQMDACSQSRLNDACYHVHSLGSLDPGETPMCSGGSRDVWVASRFWRRLRQDKHNKLVEMSAAAGSGSSKPLCVGTSTRHGGAAGGSGTNASKADCGESTVVCPRRTEFSEAVATLPASKPSPEVSTQGTPATTASADLASTTSAAAQAAAVPARAATVARAQTITPAAASRPVVSRPIASRIPVLVKRVTSTPKLAPAALAAPAPAAVAAAPAAAAAAAASARAVAATESAASWPLASRIPVLAKRRRPLSGIRDLFTFGDSLAEALSPRHCDRLAHLFVKTRGGVINNYVSIVTRHMRRHSRKPATVENVAGLIFYLIEGDKPQTCGDLLDMLRTVAGQSAVDHATEVLKRTKFQ